MTFHCHLYLLQGLEPVGHVQEKHLGGISTRCPNFQSSFQCSVAVVLLFRAPQQFPKSEPPAKDLKISDHLHLKQQFISNHERPIHPLQKTIMATDWEELRLIKDDSYSTGNCSCVCLAWFPRRELPHLQKATTKLQIEHNPLLNYTMTVPNLVEGVIDLRWRMQLLLTYCLPNDTWRDTVWSAVVTVCHLSFLTVEI